MIADSPTIHIYPNEATAKETMEERYRLACGSEPDEDRKFSAEQILCTGHIPVQKIEPAFYERFSSIVFPLKFRDAGNSGPKPY